MIARVIVDIKHESINRTFDYLIHEKDQQYIQKGVRVLVPFTDHNILRPRNQDFHNCIISLHILQFPQG